jgi:hypothetical protein
VPVREWYNDGEACYTYIRFPWDASRNQNDVGTLENLLESVVRGQVTFDFGRCSDVREIGSHTRSVNNIVQPQLNL